MPALNATTTAMFGAIGIQGSDVYNIMLNLINQGIHGGLWVLQAIWLPLLAFLVITLLFKVAGKALGWHK